MPPAGFLAAVCARGAWLGRGCGGGRDASAAAAAAAAAALLAAASA